MIEHSGHGWVSRVKMSASEQKPVSVSTRLDS